MIRMAYLDNQLLRKELEEDYLSRMDVSVLNEKWRVAKEKFTELEPLTYSVRQLLISSFGILLLVAGKYKNVMDSIDDDEKRKKIYKYLRNKVFVYTGTRHDEIIAPFFMDHAEELGLYTCHYCDMAYINIFKYTEEEDGVSKTKAQFELDHVIAQQDCPLLALALYNFVPSCSVCNSRIKHQKGLASSKKLMKKYCPTSTGFDFDGKVDIVLDPKDGAATPYMEHRDDYNIVFDCSKDKDYEKYVNKFLLTERYNCHKVEALRLKDLQLYYPDSHILGICGIVSKTFGEVKEDLFGLRFTKDEHRLFKKLRKDMLK